jgi:BolA family transcriptional regulator, general stress-responsive regulator
MTTLTEEFEQRMQALSPSELVVRDDSEKHMGHATNDGGGHLSARIVSAAFNNRPTIARHRSVYALVGDLMPHRIHALALTTLTPTEAANGAHLSEPQKSITR